MSNPRSFSRFRFRTYFILLLVVLDVALAVMLLRGGSAQGASGRIEPEAGQTLKENVEHLKFVENRGQWAGVLLALQTLTGGVWVATNVVASRAATKGFAKDARRRRRFHAS